MITDPLNWPVRAARCGWAEFLRSIFEVDPLTCPRRSAPMRVVGVTADPPVITRFLAR